METHRTQIGIAVGIVLVLVLATFIGIGPTALLVDSDLDGVYDWSDNCAAVSNEEQADQDEDGDGDACDGDDDDDGVADDDDAFPLDPEESTDLDRDGIGDNVDDDLDGDGVLNGPDDYPMDATEQFDTDGDGTGDNADGDDDADGLDDAIDPFPLTPAWNLSDEGPYKVGTQSFQFISSTDIEITVQVWYPTSDESGEDIIYDNTYPGEAWERADVDCSETHPVALYSHGTASGMRWMSGFLTEHLVRNGFIVLAPDHEDDNLFDFDDELLPYTLLRRPIDIRDSFDWMVAQSEGEGDFSGCIEPDDGYAVMGHSGGGYTSLMASGATIIIDDLSELCDEGYDYHCDMRDHWLATHPDDTEISLADDRVWGTVGLAPWTGFVLEDGVANVDNPILVLTGDDDLTTNLSMVSEIVGDLDENLTTFGVFANIGHYHFAPIGCEFYGCENQTDIGLVTNLTREAALIFLAQLLDWPGADAYALPEDEVLTWQ